MKNLVYLILIAVLVSVSVGNAVALIQHDDAVKVTGTFEVQTNPGGSAITVQNSGSFNSIKLFDIDDNQIFQFRLIGTGDRLDVVDVTNSRINMAILASNGNVGINTATPQEKLDVNGNIKLNGNIVSNGDICIGSCP
jgi:hypothetical protein